MKSIHRTVVIDDGTHVGQYCILGGVPEHSDFWNGINCKGVDIGKHCFIGNLVTIDSGTKRTTRIHDHAIILSHAHIAHDCIVESGATIAGHAVLCGHVHIMEKAYVGANSTIHQNSIMRPLSILSAGSFLKGISRMGYIMHGNPARPIGINYVGLERAGLTYEEAVKLYGP